MIGDATSELVRAGARPPARVTGLLAALGVASALRALLGGAEPAASAGAAAAFAAMLMTTALAAGWRPGATAARPSLLGAGAGITLAAVWVAARPPALGVAHLHVTSALVWWTPLVVAVAIAEEALIRGALFDAAQHWLGGALALTLTSVAFALLHVPLYGAAALPIDLAIGAVLGGLRLLTGGVAAPAVAHALADLADGWLG